MMWTFSCVLFICVLVCPTSSNAKQTEVNWCKDLYLTGENQNQLCRYRNAMYPMEIFLYTTGLFCYTYGDKSRFETVPHKPVSCYVQYTNGQYYQIYYSVLDDHSIFYYDYRNSTSLAAIKKSFKNDRYFSNWKDCAEAAMDCCKNQMTNENIISPNEEYCPVVWDAWTCFSKGTPNTIASETCPYYTYSVDTPCLLSSEKECGADGKWNDTTNYLTCNFRTNIPNIQKRYSFHVYVLYVSIALCLPAIIIFYCYPSLRVTRNILHRNLLMAITMKNIFVIMSTVLITLPALDNSIVLETNSVACRTLAFFERASINMMFACMLVDGFFLHKLIVAVFRKDPPILWLYAVVAVLTLVPAIVWSVLKTMYSNDNCWIVDNYGHQWVLDGSRYLMLGINAILLLDIIRVLLWKLKRNNGTQHTKYYYVSIKGIKSYRYVLFRTFATTIRATLILLPLFGIQFIMMSQRPVNVTCYWDDVFYYVSYTMDCSQGIIVSLFYCYLNKEVQLLLRKSYQSVKREFLYICQNTRRATVTGRRTTAATYVGDAELRRPTIKMDKIVEEPDDPKSNVQNWLQNNFVSKPADSLAGSMVNSKL